LRGASYGYALLAAMVFEAFSIHNDSDKTAHVMCTCAPAGQDAFFLAVGTPVPSRTSPVPTLSDAEVAAQKAKATALAAQYVTDFV
jgi:hypothetical protein